MSSAPTRNLAAAARAAAARAYAPYSRFSVGAAVLGGSGAVYSGSNVENASYGLSLCAERNAVAAAIAAGERTIRAVAIYTPTAAPTMPCGACRQVLFEFGADASVESVCATKRRVKTTVRALLPKGFGPDALG